MGSSLSIFLSLFIPQGTTLVVPEGRTLEVHGSVVVEGRLEVRGRLRVLGADESRFIGGHTVDPETDVGVVVRGQGVLHFEGQPCTPWLHLAADAAAGDREIVLSRAPLNWRPGEEIAIAPTDSIDADAALDAWDVVRIVEVRDHRVRIDRPLGYAHPAVIDVPADRRFTAEVLYLGRTAWIEGEPGHRIHVHITGEGRSTVRYAGVRWAGVPGKLGRYPLHWHYSPGARGTEVVGTLVRDAGHHAFVPHGVEDFTVRDSVAFEVESSAYWWDVGDRSNGVLWLRDVAARVRSRRERRFGGFVLGEGTRNEVRDSVAVSILPGRPGFSSGFQWPEGPRSPWLFRGNLAHHGRDHGIFVWQNSPFDHKIERFSAYRVRGGSVQHGAYHNGFDYSDLYALESGPDGVRLLTGPTDRVQQVWTRMTHVGGDHAVTVADSGRIQLSAAIPQLFLDYQFVGQTGATVRVDIPQTAVRPAQLLDFVRRPGICLRGGDLDPADIEVVRAPRGTLIRVQRQDGTAFAVDGSGTPTSIPAFWPYDAAAPPARPNPIPPTPATAAPHQHSQAAPHAQHTPP